MTVLKLVTFAPLYMHDCNTMTRSPEPRSSEQVAHRGEVDVNVDTSYKISYTPQAL